MPLENLNLYVEQCANWVCDKNSKKEIFTTTAPYRIRTSGDNETEKMSHSEHAHHETELAKRYLKRLYLTGIFIHILSQKTQSMLHVCFDG